MHLLEIMIGIIIPFYQCKNSFRKRNDIPTDISHFRDDSCTLLYKFQTF